ncbi:MAG: sugar ABC transporter ATP-binding protein [Fervidobacterium sp.]|uniref:Monosaccharide ABC transporter ATP-binding protein, CUT2 family n=1 Tax=Fervidobacterium gondwanense DSM 13020 TaxID=1121883 RepID=A0A1M7SS76_FERGO|nr:sugar ABC transporter ATP-binding protein [Fervidobacterium gondwanense]UXF00577.1 sugar ABC transporter ATP-binding protein [Fervidobacterium riparium]SHN61375.1 monosaccharide ABC transporter ATP-binding protein, CUT2 family [Fervidobacterium gondwanense DSM 13020]
MSYVLEMKGISKSYYGNQVLKNVSISVGEGEVLGLVGENGAGKSTLMNILFGMPVIHSTGGFEGEIIFNGQKVNIDSPLKAMELGIGMVHQEFMLLPGFTVTENIKLNREITKPNFVSQMFGKRLETLDMPTMRQEARNALDTIKMHSIDELELIARLPVAHKQFVEIAREIDKKSLKLLVLDEPTAVLTESEAENLLNVIRLLSEKGIAIIFISHRLHEILEVAHRIVILRDGMLVAEGKKEEFTIYQIAEKMVGRKIENVELPPRKKEIDEKNVIMSIKHLKVHMPGEEVRDFSIDIREGEILGIGGLAGQGKLGVANGIFGLYPAEGEVTYNGKEFQLNSPLYSLRNGIVYVSEDRRGVGLLLDESVEMNIVATAISAFNMFTKKFLGLTIYDRKAIREHAVKLIHELDIRCKGPTQPVRRLSGGNQQKVCLARAFTLNPKLLFVSEPTRGIDVGAKKLVLDYLVKLNREHGITIVLTSSELAELKSICDRIAIVAEGKVSAILPPTASDVEFGLAMAGEVKEVNVK